MKAAASNTIRLMKATISRLFTLPLAAATLIMVPALFSSCQDDVSQIGSTLAKGEVSIQVDSIVTEVESRTVHYDTFDSRTLTKLLGRINVPEYGRLSCSFVTQMLSAGAMNVPDSISVEDVDSMRLVISVPRGSLTGDSLAPQQLKVFRLTKELPAGISSTFNPEGYYNPSDPMGAQSYTLSNISKGDSALKREAYVRIPVKMPLSFGKQLFTMYRENDPALQWPATFNKFFPGIYVQQNFGNGCIANISKVEMFTYWHRINRVYEMQPDSTFEYVNHVVRDSVCLLASQPEVLSSNVIDLQLSDYIRNLVDNGEQILTTPGGYLVDVKFPVQALLDEYNKHGAVLSMVSSLKFEIPATTVKNNHGIGVAPYLLMIRKTEREDFFKNNKVPDGTTSFYAAYNSTTGSYQFNAMRDYFLKLLEDWQNGETIDGEDTEFSLVPVAITTETVQGYNTSTEYVTRCAPYMGGPTMTQLYTDRCSVCFTYSTQKID